MYKKIITLLAMGLFAGSAAFSNTTLLVNTNFDGWDGWGGGSNKFLGGVWQEYVEIGDAYPFEDRVKPTGDGFTYYSWDDGESDTLENYLLQEFGAGPAGSPTPTIFATGDVIVFKGRASATRSGTDTSDMVVRAFIKVLGYVNNQAFFLKEEYSVFHPITSTLEDFNLSIVFPDLAVDDSLQVVQLGFEITNSYDGAAMDSGTIYFENLEGYIEGGDTGSTWAGYAMDENGWANTDSWLGWVNAAQAPWIQILDINNYGYIPEDGVTESGSWMYILGK